MVKLFYPFLNLFINLFVLNYLYFFIVESSNIRIHDLMKILIDRDSVEKNFISLRLLSICFDDHCLGNDTDKNKNKNKHENKNGNVVILDHDKDDNSKRIESDSHGLKKLQWVRCMVTIEKQSREESIHSMGINEINDLTDKKANKIDSLNIHEINEFETINKSRNYNNPRCLPSILNNQNNKCSNYSNNKNDNKNDDNASIDNFIFPGFEKEVFSAAWRGGLTFCFY